MTTNIKYILFLILSMSLMSSYAQDGYKGGIGISCEEFREKNDSLYIRLKVEIKDQALDKCASMRITPYLENSDTIVGLPFIRINGQIRKKLNERWFALANAQKVLAYTPAKATVNITDKLDNSLRYEIVQPYERWMDRAGLGFHYEVTGCGNQSWYYTVRTNSSVEHENRVAYLPHPLISLITPQKEVKTRKRQGRAYLDFQVGRSVILPDFRRNAEELEKINAAITDVLSNKDVQVTGLFIEGYASPEGNYAINDKLSRDRANALKEYIRQKYNFSESIFKVNSIAEDWGGLKGLIQASDMKDKDQILAIISSFDAPDVKEAKLKSLSCYRQILTGMFPELRRVEYRIDYAVRDYSLEETRAILNRKPEDLSQLELFNLALWYKDQKDTVNYRKILIETIPRYYNEDKIANNNAAALLIENSETATAVRLLQKAGDSPQAKNNLGVVYLLTNELDKAESLLLQAQSAGIKAAAHNLEELKNKREDNRIRERIER